MRATGLRNWLLAAVILTGAAANAQTPAEPAAPPAHPAQPAMPRLPPDTTTHHTKTKYFPPLFSEACTDP